MTLDTHPENAPTALARLLRKAMGDRTLPTAAEAWGIGYHTLRRLVTGKTRPNDETIRLLIRVPGLDEESVALAIADDLLGVRR